MPRISLVGLAFQTDRRVRFEFEGKAVYVQPEKPNRFVPNRAGDELLRSRLCWPCRTPELSC